MIPAEVSPGQVSTTAAAKESDAATWYAPGQSDPASGEKISLVLYQTTSFVVTIDGSGNLNWTGKKHIKYAPDFGKIESQVALSENLVDRIFAGNENKISYKKMLGNALARLLDDKKSASAKTMLKEINHRILEHGKERVRMAYIIYALGALAFVCICLAMLIFWGDKISPRLRVNTSLFQGLTCIFLGGIGAFISTFFRFKDYKGSLVSGLPIHRLDGALRIVYGMVAGLFLCFAIKGDIIAGFASDKGLIWIMYFLAMVAGASEILVPNLIKQTETQVGLKPADDAAAEGGGKNGKKTDDTTEDDGTHEEENEDGDEEEEPKDPKDPEEENKPGETEQVENAPKPKEGTTENDQNGSETKKEGKDGGS
jgi:hypothetical protein